MKGLMITLAALAVSAAGCQKDDTALVKKLDQIDQRLASIEQTMKNAPARAGAAAAAPRQPPRRRGPDPSKVYAVPVAGAPFTGPENAKITIVKGYEYACPYCDRVRPTLDQIKEKYGDQVKIVYKNLLVHPQVATDPALATCAAHRQGKFVEMDKLVWEKGFRAGRNLSRDNMEKLASELGLKMDKFKADMDGACKEIIQKDERELRAVGAGGTPAFFINGRFLAGAQPLPRFEAVIDEELKKANEAISKGTATVATYYNEQVMKKGLAKLSD